MGEHWVMLFHVAGWGMGVFSVYCWWLVYGAVRFRRPLPAKINKLEYDSQPKLYVFGIIVWGTMAVMLDVIFTVYLFAMMTDRPLFS